MAGTKALHGDEASWKEKNAKLGYDLVREDFVDMVKEGITDATKVVRMAVENAFSVASLLLTSDTL
ncbi:MAG: hypothetical protein HC852_13515, partial [Acaryochloridaceae cyanobacterium RU_4_10]|nr:hypothetical protein [Acaryochloridaceae cyanobacterium RU_4_10]